MGSCLTDQCQIRALPWLHCHVLLLFSLIRRPCRVSTGARLLALFHTAAGRAWFWPAWVATLQLVVLCGLHHYRRQTFPSVKNVFCTGICLFVLVHFGENLDQGNISIRSNSINKIIPPKSFGHKGVIMSPVSPLGMLFVLASMWRGAEIMSLAAICDTQMLGAPTQLDLTLFYWLLSCPLFKRAIIISWLCFLL